MTSQIPKIVEK